MPPLPGLNATGFKCFLPTLKVYLNTYNRQLKKNKNTKKRVYLHKLQYLPHINSDSSVAAKQPTLPSSEHSDSAIAHSELCGLVLQGCSGSDGSALTI